MKWAQLLDRSINVGQMLVLLVIFVANQRWLKQHSAEVVWLSYVGLCCIVSIGAFYRLRAIGGLAGHLGLWLPARFWTYTLMLQANSMLGLLGGRLDYILIINTGGIRVLGQYVAVMAIASIIPRLSGFVVDSLLPSLTTCLAAGDTEAAGHVASTYLRVMFVAVFTLSVSIVLLARPALAVMGPEYLALTRLAQVAIIGAATQSLSLYTNVYFTATDCVRDSIFSTTTRIVAFGSSFWALWPVMGLAGAVLSWVIGELAYHVTSLYLIVRRPRLGLRLLRSYAGLTTAAAFSAVPSYVGAEGNYIGGALLLIPAALSFYLIAGYSAAEIREIVALLTPECIRRSNAQRQGAF